MPSINALPTRSGPPRALPPNNSNKYGPALSDFVDPLLPPTKKTSETVDLSSHGDDLVGFVRRQWDAMRRSRSMSGLDRRLIDCLRRRRGEYDPQTLAEIEVFGGSTVYPRITSNKCRGALAQLCDIFLGAERAWEVESSPNPTLPEHIPQAMLQLVMSEVQSSAEAGQPLTPADVRTRMDQLYKEATRVSRQKADEQAQEATKRIDDIQVEGGYYEALSQWLDDFVTFPYAVFKGPFVEMERRLRWKEVPAQAQAPGSPLLDGQGQPMQTQGNEFYADIEEVPVMKWARVDPYRFYWTPGASSLDGNSVVEIIPMTRSDLSALIGLPGWMEDQIRAALDDYGDSGYEEILADSSAKEALEGRSSLEYNFLDTIAWSGFLQGRYLKQLGMRVPDETKEFMATVWVLGGYVLKAQIDPDPLQRHSYYLASYEPVPGSVSGVGLPEILADVQDVCGAIVRAMVNNASIASGPQVVVNDDLAMGSDESDQLYPWKRWYHRTDPMTGTRPAVDFFQPSMNTGELSQLYSLFSNIGDEVSAIPRYLTGNERVGGAGRTASGLSMLMSNVGRVTKTIASIIDEQIIRPSVEKNYVLIMLSDEQGVLRGDESIRVKGATVAQKRDTDRMRILELLQMTNNPVDLEIIGLPGRANMLRKVVENLGMEDLKIVPSERDMLEREKLKQQMQQMQMQAMQQATAAQQPQDPSLASQGPGRGRVGAETDNMMRTRTQPVQRALPVANRG